MIGDLKQGLIGFAGRVSRRRHAHPLASIVRRSEVRFWMIALGPGRLGDRGTMKVRTLFPAIIFCLMGYINPMIQHRLSSGDLSSVLLVQPDDHSRAACEQRLEHESHNTVANSVASGLQSSPFKDELDD